MLIAPSILSADFGNLASEVQKVCQAKADMLHIDVMDGHFVPNLTFGLPIVEAIDNASTIPLDIHLMVEDNSFFVEMFAPLKPRFISFHFESEKHHHRVIQKIKEFGISPAIAINPATSIESVKEVIKYVDMVLLMSVNPGFGGQKFIPIYHKIKEVKKVAPTVLVEVDGGVNDLNAPKLKEAGVDILVAGSYVFKHSNYEQAIKSLRV